MMNREELLLTPQEMERAKGEAYQASSPRNPVDFNMFGRDKAIVEALLNKILNPEWKDQPDSEGNWWLHNSKIYLTLLCFRTKEDALNYSGEKGKWSKAIVPEIEKGE